jgi:hypothetical protein
LKNQRLAIIVGAAVAAAVALFATCGGCGRSHPNAPGAAASASASSADAAAPPPFGIARDRLWELAKDGEEEDLATLAVHEGAMGLVEGAARQEHRLTAIRAMAYARGWAQLPFLANAALAKDEAEANAALESAIDLAARPRTSEDPEDASELAEGCGKLADLAKAPEREKGRRIMALRALRMMPCPKADLPTDLDAR